MSSYDDSMSDGDPGSDGDENNGIESLLQNLTAAMKATGRSYEANTQAMARMSSTINTLSFCGLALTASIVILIIRTFL